MIELTEGKPRVKVSAVIPTFNEFEELGQTVTSLLAQETITDLDIIVVNSGKSLPPEISSRVQEITVPKECHWSCSVQTGFDAVVSSGCDYVLLLNADTEMMPGSVDKLVVEALKDEKVMACSPAYTRDEGGKIDLLYSDDVIIPFFLHNYTKRGWQTPEEAPTEPYVVSNIGGQGVLFPPRLLELQSMDPKSFPFYRGDHDFWMRAQKLGYRLVMVPTAGVINNRPFGTATLTRWQRLKRTPYLFGSPYARDSWRTIWNLHRNHQPLPIAILAFVIYFPPMVLYRLLQLVRRRVA